MVNRDLLKVFEPLIVDENGNKPKLEEFKKDFKVLVDHLLDNKINVNYNKAEISHEIARIYPITQECEYRHAFVEYPCWAVEQVILGRKIIMATPTSTMVAAKLFLDIISISSSDE